MEIIFKTPFNLLRYLSDNEKSRNLVDAVLVITFHFFTKLKFVIPGYLLVLQKAEAYLVPTFLI